MDSDYGDDKQLVDDVVKGYFLCCDAALCQSRGDVTGMDGATDADARESARRAWTMLRDSRIFSIHPKKYGFTVNSVMKCLTVAATAKLGWATDEDVKGFVHEEGSHLPFPDQLPFPNIFIGFGTRMEFTGNEPVRESIANRFKAPGSLAGMDTENVLAMLGPGVVIGAVGFVVGRLGDEPCAFACLQARGGRLKKPVILIHPVYDAEGWFQTLSYDPWLVNILVTYINSHKTYVTTRTASGNIKFDRSKAQKALKHTLPLPEPFYVVHVEDKTVDRTVKRLVAHRTVEWTHRWDVRGHEVIRIVKGAKPVSAKVRASLEKRGYTVHERLDTSHPDWKDLDTRRVNLGPNEWVAVLRSWRKAHMKGPEDRPYVPAARITRNAFAVKGTR